MASRTIGIGYDFRPDEPSGGQEADIRRAFGELGWRVNYYGGGMSNVHRCFLDLESDTNELDHPMLIATLRRLGIPLSDDPFTGISIHGDVAMPRQTADWADGCEHVVQGVRLKLSAVTVLSKDQWFDGRANGLLPTARVRCEVSSATGSALPTPFVLNVEVGTPGGDVLGSTESHWLSTESLTRDPSAEIILKHLPPETATVALRALDVHRAWKVVFRSVRVDHS
jgi:hypothetical protein